MVIVMPGQGQAQGGAAPWLQRGALLVCVLCTARLWPRGD